MLILAGIEWIFLTAASMGLCFGHVLKTLWAIQACSTYCWAVLILGQNFFYYSHHPSSKEAVGTQEAIRWHIWHSWPQLTKGISRIIWHHGQHMKLRKEGTWGHLEWWHLFFQVITTHNGAMLSWTLLNTCLLMGSSSCSVCAQLLLSLSNCLYLNPRVFLLLAFQFSSPHDSGGERGEVEVAVWLKLLARVKPQDHSGKQKAERKITGDWQKHSFESMLRKLFCR